MTIFMFQDTSKLQMGSHKWNLTWALLLHVGFFAMVDGTLQRAMQLSHRAHTVIVSSNTRYFYINRVAWFHKLRVITTTDASLGGDHIITTMF